MDMEVELDVVFVPIEDDATLTRWWNAIRMLTRLMEEHQLEVEED